MPQAALVTRGQAGLQERDQDLIPFHLAGQHPADMIARLGFESPDPQGNEARHHITANRQKIART